MYIIHISKTPPDWGGGMEFGNGKRRRQEIIGLGGKQAGTPPSKCCVPFLCNQLGPLFSAGYATATASCIDGCDNCTQFVW